MKLENIMSREMIVIESTEPIFKASQIMNEYNIGFLPVKRGKNIIGVITDRDICIRACIEKGNLKKSVDKFMTNILISIDKDEKVYDTLKTMGSEKIKRIFVTDNDEIIGIISLSDIINNYSHISELIEVLQEIFTIEKVDISDNVSVDKFKL